MMRSSGAPAGTVEWSGLRYLERRTTMKKLKPCPFCGGEAIYETFREEHFLGTKEPIIFCNSCKAVFSVEDESPFLNVDEDYRWRKKKTAEAWNRRADNG